MLHTHTSQNVAMRPPFFQRTSTKALLMVLALLVLWVASGSVSNDGHVPAVPAIADTLNQPLPSVGVVASEAKPFIRELTLNGVTENVRSVDVTPQISGVVDEVIAIEGLMVFKGEVLVKLSLDDRKAQYERAKALVKKRHLDYKVASKLGDSGYRSDATVAEFYYLLKDAQASLKTAELALDYMQIKAPYSGILERIHVDKGDVVRALETPVATVIDINPMLVTGFAPERWRDRLTEGSAASAFLNDGEEVHGVVRYVSHQAEPQTRTFRVEIEVQNGDGRIQSGMSAEMRLPLEKIYAHHVPSSILSLSDAGQLQVKTLSERDIIEVHAVGIAGEDAGGLWVTGLPAKADIVTQGQAFVNEGNRVSAVKELLR